MCDNKHGREPRAGSPLTQNLEEDQTFIKFEVEEVDKRKSPPKNKLKEKIAFKNLMREKEAMLPIDDAKLSRDH